VTLTFLSAPIELATDQSWRVGMIVFELITNAARHAFRDRGGTIRVELLMDGEQVRCRVSDDGSTARVAPAGRGSEIVEALAEELEGQIVRIFDTRGATVLLSFPRTTQVPTRRLANFAPSTREVIEAPLRHCRAI
jgi:two-component sensor histidine kinase